MYIKNNPTSWICVEQTVNIRRCMHFFLPARAVDRAFLREKHKNYSHSTVFGLHRRAFYFMMYMYLYIYDTLWKGEER